MYVKQVIQSEVSNLERIVLRRKENIRALEDELAHEKRMLAETTNKLDELKGFISDDQQVGGRC